MKFSSCEGAKINLLSVVYKQYMGLLWRKIFMPLQKSKYFIKVNAINFYWCYKEVMKSIEICESIVMPYPRDPTKEAHKMTHHVPSVTNSEFYIMETFIKANLLSVHKKCTKK